MTNFRVGKTKFVDETNRVSFVFDGKKYFGYKGDTLASALISNGIHLVGRSFKYHRPRGIMSCGSEEANAIFQVADNTDRTEPNVRATELEIYESLNVFTKRQPFFNSNNLNDLIKFWIDQTENKSKHISQKYFQNASIHKLLILENFHNSKKLIEIADLIYKEDNLNSYDSYR